MRFITEIKTFAALGSGVIGSGWVSRALAHGLDVVAWDPAPGAEAALRKRVANAWGAWRNRAWPRRVAGPPAFCRHHRGMRARRRLHPGKRPGTPGLKLELHSKISAAAKPNA
jgi:carnitine 3-dehydrogenase